MSGTFLKSYLVPGLPHILLAPEKNPGWSKVRNAMERVGQEIAELNPDVLLLYSTYWPSVLGHQILSEPEPQWVHVDDQFHDLGSIPYRFPVDVKLAESYCQKAKERQLHARTVAYKGFPVDTGSIVALKLLDLTSRLPCVITSSNIYSDRAETIVLGKAAREAVLSEGKRAVAIVVSSLSNRLFTEPMDPTKDHIHSKKDEEWNRKFLEFLEEGRLEDISQLSRQFHREARVNKVNAFKPFWWLAAVMGQNNLYTGEVLEYQPILGTGAAVVGLTPSAKAARDLEFDEDDPQVYAGERNVLGGVEEVKSALEWEADSSEVSR